MNHDTDKEFSEAMQAAIQRVDTNNLPARNDFLIEVQAYFDQTNAAYHDKDALIRAYARYKAKQK
ncbi:MAG: hypothetical protein EOP89_01435 [Lysobacteraceae bacterium]|nr:MAG: hypothetical protein EOP89_01435 [Xanthomonadaceae bacterium]